METPYRVVRLPAGLNAGTDWTHPAAWADPLWERAHVATVQHFHPRSSGHRPRTEVRLLHDADAVYVRFDVQDQYVRAELTEFQAMVCFDSCAEFFFSPRGDGAYFNLESNCGGTFLMYFIEDARRNEQGFLKSTPLRWEDARHIQIYHSLPSTVLPEREEPTPWRLGLRIPLATLEPYIGTLGPLEGQSWTGNFYKCADHTSHPHWASWTPMGERLDFHDPARFGPIHFES